MNSRNQPAVIASDDADYKRLNLARDAVAPWEDGARTDNRRPMKVKGLGRTNFGGAAVRAAVVRG
jgi:hypothetical protein